MIVNWTLIPFSLCVTIINALSISFDSLDDRTNIATPLSIPVADRCGASDSHIWVLPIEASPIEVWTNLQLGTQLQLQIAKNITVDSQNKVVSFELMVDPRNFIMEYSDHPISGFTGTIMPEKTYAATIGNGHLKSSHTKLATFLQSIVKPSTKYKLVVHLHCKSGAPSLNLMPDGYYMANPYIEKFNNSKLLFEKIWNDQFLIIGYGLIQQFDWKELRQLLAKKLSLLFRLFYYVFPYISFNLQGGSLAEHTNSPIIAPVVLAVTNTDYLVTYPIKHYISKDKWDWHIPNDAYTLTLYSQQPQRLQLKPSLLRSIQEALLSNYELIFWLVFGVLLWKRVISSARRQLVESKSIPLVPLTLILAIIMRKHYKLTQGSFTSPFDIFEFIGQTFNLIPIIFAYLSVTIWLNLAIDGAICILATVYVDNDMSTTSFGNKHYIGFLSLLLTGLLTLVLRWTEFGILLLVCIYTITSFFAYEPPKVRAIKVLYRILGCLPKIIQAIVQIQTLVLARRENPTQIKMYISMLGNNDSLFSFFILLICDLGRIASLEQSRRRRANTPPSDLVKASLCLLIYLLFLVKDPSIYSIFDILWTLEAAFAHMKYGLLVSPLNGSN